MELKPVNPWKWQDAFGFSQAVEFSGHSRVLTCAGQTSVNADGEPLHKGDMAAQLGQALDNVEAVLKQAGRRWRTSSTSTSTQQTSTLACSTMRLSLSGWERQTAVRLSRSCRSRASSSPR